MTTINAINALRATGFTSTEKTNTPQTVRATANASQPKEVSSQVAISSNAMQRASFAENMADTLAGRKALGAMVLRDDKVSSPSIATLAYDMAYNDLTDGQGGGGSVDLSGFLPGGDGILRYSSGEPVTEESKAYFNKEEARFKQERVRLYESEVAKGTPPGEIVNKLFDLEGQQPARFRAMNMWPIDADFA